MRLPERTNCNLDLPQSQEAELQAEFDKQDQALDAKLKRIRDDEEENLKKQQSEMKTQLANRLQAEVFHHHNPFKIPFFNVDHFFQMQDHKKKVKKIDDEKTERQATERDLLEKQHKAEVDELLRNQKHEWNEMLRELFNSKKTCLQLLHTEAKFNLQHIHEEQVR